MSSALQLDLSVDMALQLAGASHNLAEGRLDLTGQGRALGGESFHVIAHGASNVALSLQGLTTVTELLVIASPAISLIVNGSATPIVGSVFLFSGAAITALAVSNGSGIDAQVQMILAGG